MVISGTLRVMNSKPSFHMFLVSVLVLASVFGSVHLGIHASGSKTELSNHAGATSSDLSDDLLSSGLPNFSSLTFAGVKLHTHDSVSHEGHDHGDELSLFLALIELGFGHELSDSESICGLCSVMSTVGEALSVDFFLSLRVGKSFDSERFESESTFLQLSSILPRGPPLIKPLLQKS